MSSYLGIMKQVDQDTYLQPTNFINVSSNGFSEDNQVIMDDGVSVRYAMKHVRGNHGLSGDFTFKASPENCGIVLEALFGDSKSTKQGETTAYVHEFEPYDTLEWFTIELATYGEKARAYSGCICDSLNISATENEPVIMTPSFTGTKLDGLKSLATPSFDTLDWFNAGMTCTLSIGGTATYTVKSLDITMNNGVNKDFAVNDFLLASATPGEFTCSGTIDLIFSEAVYKLFLGSTSATTQTGTLDTVALNFKWTGDTIASTYNYELEIDIPSAVLTTESAPIVKGNRVVQTVGFNAVYNAVSGYPVMIKLTNTDTAY